MPVRTLTPSDASSPVQKIELLDDDWAIVTVESDTGEPVEYTVSRHSTVQRWHRAFAEPGTKSPTPST